MTCKEKLRITADKLEEHTYTMGQIEKRIDDVTAKLAGINKLMHDLDRVCIQMGS